MRKIRRIFGQKNHSSSKHSSEEDVDDSHHHYMNHSPAMSSSGAATGVTPQHASGTTGNHHSTATAMTPAHNQSACNSSTGTNSLGRHVSPAVAAAHQHHHSLPISGLTPEPPAPLPALVDLDPILNQLKEQREESNRLQEEIKSLKNQQQSDCNLLHQTLQEERYRYEVRIMVLPFAKLSMHAKFMLGTIWVKRANVVPN